MVLVTGGAGYIGSHVVVELLADGHDVVIIDNGVNSNLAVVDRIRRISGRSVICYKVDMCDVLAIDKVFERHKFESVLHFAALKAVGQSVAQPLKYYRNNLYSTITLLDAMQKHGTRKLVFSSSATVYGMPEICPVDEHSPLQTINPYGSTKLMSEDIIRNVCFADQGFAAIMLRYFNPVGAHSSCLIGEDPKGVPNNIMPFITGVAVGRYPKLQIFGGDYMTHDGTCLRDYIHVVDLALGHLAALKAVRRHKGIDVYNLGTGKGVTGLELVAAFEQATGVHIPYEIVDRRPGDPAQLYARVHKAQDHLDWVAKYTLQEMCADHYAWQLHNPKGYV